MKSETTTFKNIYDQSPESLAIKKIEIPIIQRDYAQGRETSDVTRIRDQFVQVLYKALTGERADAVQLDFIYGNIEDETLIPLDGQQRLTTLFLLHWYLAKKEGVSDTDQEFLNRFTYKTRISSTYFCENLVRNTPDFTEESLSAWIVDQNWFMYSWDKDPTIKSMLVMLDKIHSMFRNEKNLWQHLTDSNRKPVSFYFLSLEDMGLTDSLYIKMNSRGKPLTPFEHFKAELGRIIKKVSEPLYKEFIYKVDVDWVDMLWKYRNENNRIDEKFMRYYRFITEMLCYEQDIEILQNNFELAKNVYGSQNKNAVQNLKFLFQSFDSWVEIEHIDQFFNSIFQNNEYSEDKVCLFSDEKNLFNACCQYYTLFSGKNRQFSLNNTLLLYANVLYLNNKSDIEWADFISRIRIIRNLVMNSPSEIRKERMTGLLSDVNQIMLKGEVNLKTQGFNENQKKEEIEKQKWRSENKELSVQLDELEDHFLLQGSIAIIGLTEVDKFKNRAKNFIGLFNGQINYKKISRALLTIGDYSQLISWRFLFGNNHRGTWRDLFTPSQQRKGFEKTRGILLTLIDTISGDFDEYLENMVQGYLQTERMRKDWKYYLIKYPSMRKGESGYFCWDRGRDTQKEKQYKILMMNTSKSLNGKHWNPFLYTLKHDPEFSEFFSLDHYRAPMVFRESNDRLVCENDCWKIEKEDGQMFSRIAIPQRDGFDTEDRIELMKVHLRNYLGLN